MLFLKKIIKISFYATLIIALISIVFYYYFKNSVTDLITEKELSELVTDIKTSSDLPDKFYELYEKEKPNNLKYSSKRVLISNSVKEIFSISEKDNRSPSTLVAQTYMLVKKINERRRDFKINQNIIAWNIEDYVNQKECINWLVENGNSPDIDKSLKIFSEDYYKKKISQFDERELAGIIIIMQNPDLNNPIKRKERFDNIVTLLLRRFHKKKN